MSNLKYSMIFMDLILKCVSLPLFTNQNEIITYRPDTKYTHTNKYYQWADDLCIPSDNDFVFTYHIIIATLNRIIREGRHKGQFVAIFLTKTENA